jgi:hypothetical protein
MMKGPWLVIAQALNNRRGAGLANLRASPINQAAFTIYVYSSAFPDYYSHALSGWAQSPPLQHNFFPA